ARINPTAIFTSVVTSGVACGLFGCPTVYAIHVFGTPVRPRPCSNRTKINCGCDRKTMLNAARGAGGLPAAGSGLQWARVEDLAVADLPKIVLEALELLPFAGHEQLIIREFEFLKLLQRRDLAEKLVLGVDLHERSMAIGRDACRASRFPSPRLRAPPP